MQCTFVLWLLKSSWNKLTVFELKSVANSFQLSGSY